MNLPLVAPTWLAGLFVLLLVLASVEDSWRLRISNWTCLGLIAAAFAAAWLAGPRPSLWQNLLVFAALLGVGLPIFAAGKFGGGDVKLFAAAGLWFSLDGAWRFLMLTLLAGGLLAMIILAVRLVPWGAGARDRVVVLRRRGGIPYGVAIASGALLTAGLLPR
ncbi:hypothetical protein HMF7854_01745 [Sphingomonas ginkgonis]|uniref:Prepilin type IV endopeptidase peptidase domain-containing protein n=1 Tax=Sphingomonas ginkgonis TaxID=2315330 RepID=A0A3S0EKF3_9SPHN|nr:prepilin peptidase [Sphingomonas ginkgonis]RST29690.1 hypothetical protein HMF7854_01745 [Sphingomonas ginkgonis]